MFRAAAVPALFETRGDSVAVSVSVPGSDAFDLTVIRAESSVEWAESNDGTGRRVRVQRQALHCTMDAGSAYAVLGEFHAKATFTFDGGVWSRDDTEGRGIQGLTPNMCAIHVLRVLTQSATAPNHLRSVR